MSSPHPVSVCPIESRGPPCDTSWKMVLEISPRRRSAPLLPPFDHEALRQIYSPLRDRNKLRKKSQRNGVGSVRRKNQRSANCGVTARRRRAYRARRIGKKFRRNIARSLPFHGTPQETGRMLLKMEKHVNACVIVILIALALSSAPYVRKANKNALAHGVSCGRLALV